MLSLRFARPFCRDSVRPTCMTDEKITTTLRFVGDWPWWLGTGAALALGGSAYIFYRRDVRTLSAWLRWILPGVRGLSIVMLGLMLCGPVLHHRKVIGRLSVLRVFVDGSQSMQLTDASMSAARKVMILQRMGLLSPDAVKTDLPQASEALAEAESIAGKAGRSESQLAADWKKLTADFFASVGEARERLAQAAEEGDRLQRFGQDLYDPAAALAAHELERSDDRDRVKDDLAHLAEVARRWQEELAQAFQKMIDEPAATDGFALRATLQKFDTTPRWERVQSILLEGQSPTMLAQFAENYDVQLFDLHGSEAKALWQPTVKDSALPKSLPKPDGLTTDLATGVKSSAGQGEQEQHGAVVLFSDGQHNDGESPVEVGKLLGARQMPIFTVGLGSETRPRDLAIVKSDAPEAVFYEDRVRGEITLKDDFPAGQPFKVRITDGEDVLWEKSLLSENKQLRKVPFDFAIKDIVDRRLATKQTGDVQVSGFPLELKVAISHLDDDREPANDEGVLRLRAVTQKRKILIVDGRPRWETRYLRNLFDRDEQWEVQTVIAGTKAGEPGFERGEKAGEFPADAAQLETFDLIVLGEVPVTFWQGDELKWIADFVAQRGGALLLIDGARGHFRRYGDSPLGPVFPVELKSAGITERISKLVLTERGEGLSPFLLVGDRAQNNELWQTLPAPHWISGATPLPGAEVLLEAEVKGAYTARVPVIVERPFGAGKVLYHGFDESWRWRHEVADQHHVRYWNQIASWIAELPFAVRDKFVSLDAGALTYQPGEAADLRARLRDGDGRRVTNATVDAVLYRDGRKAATIRLNSDESAGGLYRGKTAPLEPGSYEIGIQTAAIAERDLQARTQFKVQPRETGERTLLSLDEELLKQIAAVSGGQYLREENIDKLGGLLAPISQGKVIESDTVLWQSYWWFGPIIGLLTIEWILRKRSGLL